MARDAQYASRQSLSTLPGIQQFQLNKSAVSDNGVTLQPLRMDYLPSTYRAVAHSAQKDVQAESLPPSIGSTNSWGCHSRSSILNTVASNSGSMTTVNKPLYDANMAFPAPRDQFRYQPDLSSPQNGCEALESRVITGSFPLRPVALPQTSIGDPRSRYDGTAQLSRLERLPAEVRATIWKKLDFKSLIRLRQVNRFISCHVDIQVLDYDSKVAFIRHAETTFPQHWRKKLSFSDGKASCLSGNVQPTFPTRRRRARKNRGVDDIPSGASTRKDVGDFPGNFACYFCFKVLGPENFGLPDRADICEQSEGETIANAANPTTQSVFACDQRRPLSPSPRRYCILCGVREGFYKPQEYIERRIGGRVWACRCLRVHEYGTIKCEYCQQLCPFSSRKRGSSSTHRNANHRLH